MKNLVGGIRVIKSRHILTKFVKFLGVGSIATIIQYCLLIFLVELFSLNHIIASSLSFIISSIINYTMNYKITFNSNLKHRIVFPRFVVIVTFGVILNTTILKLSIDKLELHYILAQIISTTLILFWNFIANYFWSFKENKLLTRF